MSDRRLLGKGPSKLGAAGMASFGPLQTVTKKITAAPAPAASSGALMRNIALNLLKSNEQRRQGLRVLPSVYGNINPVSSRRSSPPKEEAPPISPRVTAEPGAPSVSASPPPNDPSRASPPQPKRGVLFETYNNSKNISGRNKNTRGYRGKLNLTPYLPKRSNNNATRKHKQNTLERILARRKITDEEIRTQIAERILLENTFGESWSEARYALSKNAPINNMFDSKVTELLEYVSHIPLSHNDFEATVKQYSLNATTVKAIRSKLNAAVASNN